jgi:hypothetical protein
MARMALIKIALKSRFVKPVASGQCNRGRIKRIQQVLLPPHRSISAIRAICSPKTTKAYPWQLPKLAKLR